MTPSFKTLIIVAFAALSLSFAPHALAQAKFSSAYMNAACFNTEGANPLEGQNITVNPPVDGNRQMLINGVIARINKLKGDNLLTKRLSIRIHEGGKSFGSKCASYTSSGSSIELVTKCRSSDTPNNTAAHFAHEMGHIAGLRSFYGSYQGQNPVCRLTHYCTNNSNKNPRNEEFAEVFATYLHAPNVLQSRCPKQFEWMKMNVFRGADPFDGCTGNPNWANYNYGNDGDLNSHGQQGMDSGGRGGLAGIMDIIKALEEQQAQIPPADPNPQPQNFVPQNGNAVPEVPKGPVYPWEKTPQ